MQNGLFVATPTLPVRIQFSLACLRPSNFSISLARIPAVLAPFFAHGKSNGAAKSDLAAHLPAGIYGAVLFPAFVRKYAISS